LTGAFLCAQAVGRALIEQGEGGRIVNVASVAGLYGAPAEVMNTIVYHASKGGLIAFTRDLAWKWARHGITVNAIAPGWFPTDMSRYVLDRQDEAFLRTIPLGRFGGPDDLKGAVGYLASRAADFVTGHVLVVDGGQTA
jgi:NAD(P)-dependent dehydrogenase (short-subunit alcohol dehydrogenase family)